MVDRQPQGWHEGAHFYCYLNEEPLRLAFVVKTTPEEEAVCVDGNVGELYSKVKDIHFAEGVLAYLAKTKNEKWTIAVEHENGELCETEKEAVHSNRYRKYFIKMEDSTRKILPSDL